MTELDFPPCFRCPKLDHDAMGAVHADWAPYARCCQGKCSECGAALWSIKDFWKAFEEPFCPMCLLTVRDAQVGEAGTAETHSGSVHEHTLAEGHAPKSNEGCAHSHASNASESDLA